MPNSINEQPSYSHGEVSDAGRRQFEQTLGLARTERPTLSLSDFSPGISNEGLTTLAERGRAIRSDLSEPLDGDVIDAELETLAAEFDRIPALRTIGVPEYGETPYQDLTPAAWRLENHLDETEFFEVAEENLPAFTADHIETTTRRLLEMDSVPEMLSRLGFTDEEQLSLVTNVVNAGERLSWWQPTERYPPVTSEDGYDEGIVHDTIPPLHQRAMAGALLWIDGLDWWIWQHEVLITDDMIDRAVWDVKSMLAGVYLLGEATRGLATERIVDEDLTTLLTAGSAIAIVSQEQLAKDVAWIDDEMRKPLTDDTEGSDS